MFRSSPQNEKPKNPWASAALQRSFTAGQSSPSSSSRSFATFAEIQKDEQKSLIARKEQEKKAFAKIQMEEEAIETLLQIYHAEEVFDEYVTVERVSGGVVADPIWKALV